MKRKILMCMIVALGLVGCNSSYQLSTSHRVNLSHKVLYTPTLANVQVESTRVSATLSASQVAGLSDEQAKQSVVAAALSTAAKQNGSCADILVVPRFVTARENGKMVSITVSGYPASFTSFRPMTKADAVFAETLAETKKVESRLVVNSLIIADVQIDAKKVLNLTGEELTGKSESQALAFAKKKMIRLENADFLYEPQHSVSVAKGLEKFSLSAFPAKYVNYRKATTADMSSLMPTEQPVVYYNTIADIQAQTMKQLRTYSNSNNVNQKELKEKARNEFLNEFNADIILNEQVFFDYAGKVLTSITITGTPASYGNFRPISGNDVVDGSKSTPQDSDSDKPTGFAAILRLFQKK